METFIQPKVIGYRQLTEEEATLMNEVKQKGIELEALKDKLNAIPELDKRWVAIGTTNMQQGLMAWVRSIARPTTF
jgi:hypothetical protein